MTPEEIELLSQLTIVIPTYNQPLELERSIEYWRDTPVTVHILDGSDEPWFPVGVLPGVGNVFYHHLLPTKGEHWRVNFVRRLEFATALTRTKFSALCACDDAFSVSGLIASLKLLENTLDLDAVVGQALGFYPQNSSVHWWLRYGVSSVDNRFSKDTDAVVRLMRSRSKLYYCVCRTDLWNKRIQITKKHPWLGERWETLFQDVSNALFRAKTINQIVWFRFKTVRHPHESTHVYMREWASGQGNYQEVDSYIDILVEAILLVSPDSDQYEIKDRIHEFVMHHPESRGHFYRLNPVRKAFLLRLFSKLDENTMSYVPVYLREIVARNYIPAKIRAAIGSKKVLDEFLPDLSNTGIEFDINELQDLETLWIKPREELRLRANI